MCWQVLNLLLYALTKRDPDQQLLEFLAVDEMLVDIGDDLVDYEVPVLPPEHVHGHCWLMQDTFLLPGTYNPPKHSLSSQAHNVMQ